MRTSALLAAMLLAAALCPAPAHAEPVEQVSFVPRLGERLSARRDAAPTDDTPQALRAASYVEIGEVHARMRMRGEDEDIDASVDAALHTAAREGGDLVAFSVRGASDDEVRLRERCALSPEETGLVILRTLVTGSIALRGPLAAHVPITDWCKGKYVTTVELALSRSAGTVWRLDPVLSERLQRVGALIDAIATDDTAIIAAHLSGGGDPSRSEDLDLVRTAATHGASGSLALLLEAGAKRIDAPSDDAERSLWLAADAGSAECARLLLEAGAKVDRPGREGRTPLHAAAATGNAALVALLLEHGAKIDRTDHKGRTPLQIAASNDEITVVATLLAAGADATVENERGNLALRGAIAAGNPHMVTLLADAGGRLGPGDLYLAVGAERTDLLALLIALGAEIDGQWTGETALHRAAREGFADGVALLLEARATVDAPSANTSLVHGGRPTMGWTPLMFAVDEDHPVVVEALLDAGADPKRETSSGTTAADLVHPQTTLSPELTHRLEP